MNELRQKLLQKNALFTRHASQPRLAKLIKLNSSYDIGSTNTVPFYSISLSSDMWLTWWNFVFVIWFL